MLFGRTREDQIKHKAALEAAKNLLNNDQNFSAESAAEYYESLRYNEIETYTYLSHKGYIYRPIAELWEKSKNGY